jgi:hypothetical protein
VRQNQAQFFSMNYIACNNSTNLLNYSFIVCTGACVELQSVLVKAKDIDYFKIARNSQRNTKSSC